MIGEELDVWIRANPRLFQLSARPDGLTDRKGFCLTVRKDLVRAKFLFFCYISKCDGF